MTTGDDRAHGVTPVMRQDYATRTAQHQAAFLLPHLRPGMRVLDIGCGPATITLGLAAAVAPGEVIGIDHDPMHIDEARTHARDSDARNVAFRTGDALALPFDDASFDIAYENNVLIHVSDRASDAVREAYRVLRPD